MHQRELDWIEVILGPRVEETKIIVWNSLDQLEKADRILSIQEALETELQINFKLSKLELGRRQKLNVLSNKGV